MLRHTNAYIKALDATHHINAVDDDDMNERGRYQQRLKRHQQQPADDGKQQRRTLCVHQLLHTVAHVARYA